MLHCHCCVANSQLFFSSAKICLPEVHYFEVPSHCLNLDLNDQKNRRNFWKWFYIKIKIWKRKKNPMSCFGNNTILSIRSGASSPPRQPRQLPWLIFETIIDYQKWPKQLGRFQEKKYPYFSTKQTKKNSLNVLSFLQNWKNGFIILPSKKSS